MSRVSTVSAHLQSVQVPRALQGLRGWLMWRYEHHEGEPKPRKVPYYADRNKRRGTQGSPEDRERLVTFEAARAAAAKAGFDGVGLALMQEFGIVALDFDHCVGGAGIDPEVERLVLGTYAEFSPSGTGVRAFYQGDLGGNQKSLGEHWPFGFEAFSSKGFVTVTGQALPATAEWGCADTVAPLTDDVREFAQMRFGAKAAGPASVDDDPFAGLGPKMGLTVAQWGEAIEVIPPDIGREEWIRVGMGLHHELDGSEEGFELWDEWSAGGTKYPGQESLRTQWASFGKRTLAKPVTGATLIDLSHKHGGRVGLAALVSAEAFASAVEASPSECRYQVVPAVEFAAGKHPGWIVKGLIPRADLVMVFGEPGSGKSFLALDIGAAIARGQAWRGLRVKQGRVVCVVAEGGGGFRARLSAWAQGAGASLEGLDLGVIHAAPNLLDREDAVHVARAIGRASVVIIDTLAQTTPGANENAAEDMGRALAHCRRIAAQTGSTVVLVHHAGKDTTKGARGWSGLRAAVDAEVEVVRDGAFRFARVSKQKDGEDGGVFPFRLEQCVVGLDEDGEEVTSCFISHEAEMPPEKIEGPRGAKQKAVLQAAVNYLKAHGSEEMDRLSEVCKTVFEAVAGGRDRRGEQARRALEKLIDSQFLARSGSRVVLATDWDEENLQDFAQ